MYLIRVEQGHSSHGGNEAEIFIIAILVGEEKSFKEYTSEQFAMENRAGPREVYPISEVGGKWNK